MLCKLTFDAIGTKWSIEIDQPLNSIRLAKTKQKIMERIDTFDKVYSRFRNDSLVTAISKKPGVYTFPEDAQELFAFYKQLYDITSGKVTPLIGDLLVAAGYDASYSLKPAAQLPRISSWDDIMSYTHPHLTTTTTTMLDFGAAGKGYLVDIIANLLEKEGVTTYLIDAGGDMLIKQLSKDAVDMGLEHPKDSTKVIGIGYLNNGSICGSSGNRRRWAGMHHILDPDSASSVKSILATWVTADRAILADGLATALFFTDPTILKKSFSFEYCLIREDLSYSKSNGFKAKIFG